MVITVLITSYYISLYFMSYYSNNSLVVITTNEKQILVMYIYMGKLQYFTNLNSSAIWG